MNWQTVIIVYCIWMMGISVIGLIRDKRNMERHFEQGERIYTMQDPIQQKQEKLLSEIEKEIRRCKP